MSVDKVTYNPSVMENLKSYVTLIVVVDNSGTNNFKEYKNIITLEDNYGISVLSMLLIRRRSFINK